MATPAKSSGAKVNVANFERAESDQIFAGIAKMAGGVSKWFHHREPTPVEQQPIIRMNRDTLCSGTIVDMSGGAVRTPIGNSLAMRVVAGVGEAKPTNSTGVSQPCELWGLILL